MVKLRGPGLSVSASGSIADTLTFSRTRGRAYLKHKPTPAQPQSGAQVSMRAMMQWLTQQWTNLSAAEQTTWIDIYPDPSLSPYNSFLKYNLERWRRKHAPSKEYPAAETGSAGVTPRCYCTGGVRHIAVQCYEVDSLQQTWLYLLFHSSTSTPDDDFDKLIKICPAEMWPPPPFIHTPLPPGTHYYRVVATTTTGKYDPAKTHTDDAVVT